MIKTKKKISNNRLKNLKSKLKKKVIVKKSKNSKAVIKKKLIKSKKNKIKKDLQSKKNYELTLPSIVKMTGSITTAHNIRIHGQFEGEIICSKLIIEKNGKCFGKAKVDDAEIEGSIELILNIKNDILIKSSATILGDIEYGNSLNIESGAKVFAQIAPKKKPLLLTYDKIKLNENESHNNNYIDAKKEETLTNNPTYKKSITNLIGANKEKAIDKVIKSIFKK